MTTKELKVPRGQTKPVNPVWTHTTQASVRQRHILKTTTIVTAHYVGLIGRDRQNDRGGQHCATVA
jgi:hypothetical protein